MAKGQYYPKDVIEMDINEDINANQNGSDDDIAILIDEYQWRIQQLEEERERLLDVKSKLQNDISAEVLAQKYTDCSESNGDIENLYDFNVDASNLHDYLKVVEKHGLFQGNDVFKEINRLIKICTYKQRCLYGGIGYFIDL